MQNPLTGTGYRSSRKMANITIYENQIENKTLLNGDYVIVGGKGRRLKTQKNEKELQCPFGTENNAKQSWARKT